MQRVYERDSEINGKGIFAAEDMHKRTCSLTGLGQSVAFVSGGLDGEMYNLWV